MKTIATRSEARSTHPRPWRPGRRIGARLLLLLLAAEAPLVLFTAALALQNRRLQASDAVSEVGFGQKDVLARLSSGIRFGASLTQAAAALPAPLQSRRLECDAVLAALVNSSSGRVLSLTLTDPSGAILCASPGAPPLPLARPRASLQTQIIASAAGVGLWRRRDGPGGSFAGQVIATLAQAHPAAALRSKIHSPPVLVWFGTETSLVPVESASSGAVSAGAMPSASIVQRGRPVSLKSQDGRPFLYTAAALGDVLSGGEILLAGSDIRDAGVAARRALLLRAGALIAFFIAEFLLIAGGISLVVSRPLRRLNDAVDRWRREGRFCDGATAEGPLEVGLLSTSFAQATESLSRREQELQQAIGRQEALMLEIHHRVKNNLQIIASLLNLQSARIKVPEAQAEFQSARDRVRALATLHRYLYNHGEFDTIDMRGFLGELCEQLFQSAREEQGARIALDIAATEVKLSSDQAVPIALIVTETVGNAIKYAFPGDRRGHIRVSFTLESPSRATLIVRDDGVGLDQRDSAQRSGEAAGLGLQLIRGFANQLGGDLTITTEGGTCYRLAMPIHAARPCPSQSARAADAAAA